MGFGHVAEKSRAVADQHPASVSAASADLAITTRA